MYDLPSKPIVSCLQKSNSYWTPLENMTPSSWSERSVCRRSNKGRRTYIRIGSDEIVCSRFQNSKGIGQHWHRDWYSFSLPWWRPQTSTMGLKVGREYSAQALVRGTYDQDNNGGFIDGVCSPQFGWVNCILSLQQAQPLRVSKANI